jgi:small subunit ribosomal protein S1
LLHVADISFKRVENIDEVVKVGQEMDVVVAQLEAGQRKIGLHPAPPEGEEDIKQRIAPHKQIKVVVVAHDPGGLFVRILGATGRQARGFVPAGQTGTPRGTDLRKQFPVGSKQDVKVIDLDPRRGEVKLSIKALREDNEKAAYNEYRQAVQKEAKFGTFADLLNKNKS